MSKRSKMRKMLKQIAGRLLLFGIPFALSYLATRPVTPPAVSRTFVVCTYPGDRPGELRISLDPVGCPDDANEAKTIPARNIPQNPLDGTSDKAMKVPF
jgi:hypothetical protein